MELKCFLQKQLQKKNAFSNIFQKAVDNNLSEENTEHLICDRSNYSVKIFTAHPSPTWPTSLLHDPLHPFMNQPTPPLHDPPTPTWPMTPHHDPPHPTPTWPMTPLHDPPHPSPTWPTSLLHDPPPPLHDPPHPFMTHPPLHDPWHPFMTHPTPTWPMTPLHDPPTPTWPMTPLHDPPSPTWPMTPLHDECELGKNSLNNFICPLSWLKKLSPAHTHPLKPICEFLKPYELLFSEFESIVKCWMWIGKKFTQ